MRALFAILLSVIIAGCVGAAATVGHPTPRKTRLASCLDACPGGEPETIGDFMAGCRVRCHSRWGRFAVR